MVLGGRRATAGGLDESVIMLYIYQWLHACRNLDSTLALIMTGPCRGPWLFREPCSQTV